MINYKKFFSPDEFALEGHLDVGGFIPALVPIPVIYLWSISRKMKNKKAHTTYGNTTRARASALQEKEKVTNEELQLQLIKIIKQNNQLQKQNTELQKQLKTTNGRLKDQEQMTPTTK